MDLQLELLETKMSEWTLPIWQKLKKEIIYEYSLGLKNYKLMWDDLLYRFVFKTQTWLK